MSSSRRSNFSDQRLKPVLPWTSSTAIRIEYVAGYHDVSVQEARDIELAGDAAAVVGRVPEFVRRRLPHHHEQRIARQLLTSAAICPKDIASRRLH